MIGTHRSCRAEDGRDRSFANPGEPKSKTALNSEATAALFQPTFVATTKRKASAEAQFPRRQLHRFDDLRIGAAAARIARQVVTDLVVAWVGMRCEPSANTAR